MFADCPAKVVWARSTIGPVNSASCVPVAAVPSAGWPVSGVARVSGGVQGLCVCRRVVSGRATVEVDEVEVALRVEGAERDACDRGGREAKGLLARFVGGGWEQWELSWEQCRWV